MQHLIESYENYNEEDRITTNNARRIEYITNLRAILENIAGDGTKILDVGAGTGAYAIELAKRGLELTALDITPRHVSLMKNRILHEKFSMQAELGNAIDLSAYDNSSFDVVLNMGPYYHLTDKEERDKCLKESIRVLKSNGILVLAYIGRLYIYQYMGLANPKYLDHPLSRQILKTGVMRSTDEGCFWTDAFFALPNAVEAELEDKGLTIIDHIASDGMAPAFKEKMDNLSEEEFTQYCENHYHICREPSILGSSNHGLVFARKTG